MSRQTINLNGDNWRFGQVPRRSFAATDVYDLPAVAEWLPATVPGNVRPDLLALGRIPDPFLAEDYKESLWVEEVDWWYRRELQLDSLPTGRRAFLVFEGLDYLSAIFVNGQELARHEGMFSRQLFEITAALQTGAAEVAVRLWGSSALPRRQLTRLQGMWQKIAGLLYRSWAGVYPDRSATLKCQMSFGWDFAPPIRTMGIWDDVHLLISGPVFIAEASAVGWPVLATQDLPSLPALAAPARLSINLTLDADRPGRIEVVLRVSPANFQGAAPEAFQFWLDLPAGRSAHRLELQLSEAALWQPWDRGQPHLYHLQITLVEPDGKPLDEKTIRTGIRAIERQNWQFNLNGQREFIRGLNWVPADSFPGRLRPDHYTRLLTLARRGGANLLRVWGGGLREKQAFYDLCDELGLLVWQEFPFACMFLGDYPRYRSYLSQVEAECGAIVRQLRHHPSVVTWCGGNEFSRRRNRPLLDTLAAVVRQHDGTRPFIPVSPSFDHGGDAHNWNVWHGDAPIQTYQTESASFLSEFGLQALPHLDSLKAALPDPTTGWQTHHADPQKLERYASLFNPQSAKHTATSTPGQDRLRQTKSKTCPGQPELHPERQPTPERAAVEGPDKERSQKIQSLPSNEMKGLKSKIQNSQCVQAVALQTAIEHMRRRKDETGGVCLWQFNEPWPAISWAIVDYFGRPKLAYKRLWQWYNPILVSLKFPAGHCWPAGQAFKAEIWAINDGQQTFKDCQLQIKIDDAPVYTQSFDLPRDSAQRLGVLACRLTTSPRQITLALHHKAEILAQNSYDLDWSDESSGSVYRRLRRWVADWVLR